MRGETQRSGRQTERVGWRKNGNREWEQWESEKVKGRGGGREGGKTHASHPAVRGECFSKLGADVGRLGVFIDLQGFNPQYWPKPLVEGCEPT